jgi:hypothetical protein
LHGRRRRKERGLDEGRWLDIFNFFLGYNIGAYYSLFHKGIFQKRVKIKNAFL